MAIVGSTIGVRKLASWIDSFHEYTEVLYAPALFRKWAGISTLSGVLERRVWTVTRGSAIYPNLYVLLAGPPGVGKSLVISEVNKFWRTLTDLHIAPSSVTRASLNDCLSDAKVKVIRPTEIPPYLEFNSLQVGVSEFSEFAPVYDMSLMSALQNFYDGVPYEERKRGKDLKIVIPAPQMSMIAGTTPSYLNTFMPEGAWDQGFISRTLIIFSGESLNVQLFDLAPARQGLFDALKADLKLIHNLFGKLEWSVEAATAIQAWVTNGEEPKPDHRRLLHYATRRKAHLIKLAMVASVSRSNGLTIEIQDFRQALDWLIEAETYMPDIFKAMASGGDSAVMEDTWHYLWSIFAKEQKPILEGRIYEFMRDRAPAYTIKSILEAMVRSNMLEIKAYGQWGKTLYAPTPKHIHRDSH